MTVFKLTGGQLLSRLLTMSNRGLPERLAYNDRDGYTYEGRDFTIRETFYVWHDDGRALFNFDASWHVSACDPRINTQESPDGPTTDAN